MGICGSHMLPSQVVSQVLYKTEVCGRGLQLRSRAQNLPAQLAPLPLGLSQSTLAGATYIPSNALSPEGMLSKADHW